MKNTNITSTEATLLKATITAHNNNIDTFFDVTLVNYFGSDRFTDIAQWFEAQRLIGQQNFYEKGREIMEIVRAYGLDCKINMQSNKLVCSDLGIY